MSTGRHKCPCRHPGHDIQRHKSPPQAGHCAGRKQGCLVIIRGNIACYYENTVAVWLWWDVCNYMYNYKCTVGMNEICQGLVFNMPEWLIN